MPSITLTLPTAGTVITAGLHANNFTSLQSLLNGGLDTANWGAGKIFAPSKLLQEGATTSQVLAWNGTIWAPASASYVTALPGSPIDGQEATLVDSLTNPSYQWRFRYNAGSALRDKWECVGAASQVVEVATSETTASATYAALATAGPVFVVPRLGIYTVDMGYDPSSVTVACHHFMSYDIGGTGAVDADAVQGEAGAASVNRWYGLSRKRFKDIAAATTLTAKYRTTAGTVGFENRWMQVTPIRVS